MVEGILSAISPPTLLVAGLEVPVVAQDAQIHVVTLAQGQTVYGLLHLGLLELRVAHLLVDLL